MQTLFRSTTFAALLSTGTLANAGITGDLSGGGLFSDDVSTDNGWIVESAAGNGVDFWTISLNAGDSLSISIDSSIDFGISLYQGTVFDDLGFSFDNDGDFNGGTYITGTNGIFGEAGSNLTGITLADAGIYTVALGGDLGFGGFGPFAYNMSVSVISANVPVTASLPLAGLALAMFGLGRRRQV